MANVQQQDIQCERPPGNDLRIRALTSYFLNNPGIRIEDIDDSKPFLMMATINELKTAMKEASSIKINDHEKAILKKMDQDGFYCPVGKSSNIWSPVSELRYQYEAHIAIVGGYSIMVNTMVDTFMVYFGRGGDNYVFALRSMGHRGAMEFYKHTRAGLVYLIDVKNEDAQIRNVDGWGSTSTMTNTRAASLLGKKMKKVGGAQAAFIKTLRSLI